MRSRQRFEGQSAVIMQLAVIGEISKRLSAEFRKCVSLPWRQIARFRDRAVPDYYQLDLEYVWLTIQDDIPLLRNALEMPPDGSQRLDLDVGGPILTGRSWPSLFETCRRFLCAADPRPDPLSQNEIHWVCPLGVAHPLG